MSCAYFIRDDSYARELIRGLLDLVGLRVPACHARQAVNVCDNKLRRYIRAGVGECGCVVIVADTEGRDPAAVTGEIEMHARRAGLELRGRPSLDRDFVGVISLSPAGAVIVMLAHPCLEAWLADLLGAGSGLTCREVVDATKRRIGGYDKKLLPGLVLERVRGANPLPAL
jgi:hypothetical protein